MLKTPGAHCTGYTSGFFGLVMRIILLLEGLEEKRDMACGHHSSVVCRYSR
jgi:hypothetical protein